MRPVTKHQADVRSEAPMNRSGSYRPWTYRLLSLATTFALCFAFATSLLHAQQNCAFADVNGDGVVDDADLLQVLFCFGTSTPLTIPDIDEMVAMRLTAAFPTHFPGAPDVPFNPQDAAFARTRRYLADTYYRVSVAWNTRADFAQFTPEQIAQGLVVGAVYLPQGRTPTGVPLRQNYYLLRLHSPDQINWYADLLEDNTGNSVATNIPVDAMLIEPYAAPHASNDLSIKNLPDGAVEVSVSYRCPNGHWVNITILIIE
jgi:hypothetical protein